MSLFDYLTGALLFVVMLGSASVGALLVLRRFLPGLRGAEAVTAFGVILSAALLAIHLGPAMLGLLGRGSVTLTSLVWLGGCLMARPKRKPLDPLALPERALAPPHSSWITGVSVVAVLLVAVFFLAFVRNQAYATSGSIDFGTFHLPNVISWIQTGSIWQIDNFVPDVALGNYPNNGDVMLLAFVLPWHNDFLVHGAMWMFYALTGASVYALARRMGAISAVALLAACLVLAIPSVGLAALPNSMTDAVALFGFTAGVVFLIRHATTNSTSDLVLAGLALGICFGTKWYSVSTVVIVVGVWLAARVIARHESREVLRDGVTVTGLVGLAGGVWFLRNWTESGNPLFPVKIELAGLTIFDAPRDVVRDAAGFTIADYIGNWDAWWKAELPGGVKVDGIVLQWADALAAPAAIIAFALLAAAPFVLRSWRRQPFIAAVLVAAGLLLAAYSITPYTAGGPPGVPLLVGADSRYAVPALIAGAVVVAALASVWRSVQVGLAILAVPAVVHGLLRTGSGELSPARLSGEDWLLGAAGAGAVLALAWLVKRRPPLSKSARRIAVTALALAVLGGGYAVQKRFNELRYVGSDRVLDALVAELPEGPMRIGLAGLWSDEGLAPIVPAFGPRFDNDVSYIAFEEDTLLRRFSDQAAFVEAVEDGEFDAVIVGRGRPGVPPVEEGDWLRSAGWQIVAESDRFELYKRL